MGQTLVTSLSETVTIGNTIYYSLFTSSRHSSLRDLCRTNCTNLFHHVREPPPLNTVSMKQGNSFICCVQDRFGEGKQETEAN